MYKFGSDNGTRTTGTAVLVPAAFRLTSAADFRLVTTWDDLPDFEETQRTSRRTPRRDISRGERPLFGRRSRNDLDPSAAVERRSLRLSTERSRATALAALAALANADAEVESEK